MTINGSRFFSSLSSVGEELSKQEIFAYVYVYIYLHSPDRLSMARVCLCMCFSCKKLPSLVETIIVMTIQIVAHDKGNDFLACRSLSLVFFSSLFRLWRYLATLLVRLQAWRLRPSSFFLHPSLPLSLCLSFSLTIIALASCATTRCLPLNAKVVTNRRKKK